MKTTTILGLALAAYVAVPLIRRAVVGCPPFAGKVINVNGTNVQACQPISPAELLLWPVGFFVAGK